VIKNLYIISEGRSECNFVKNVLSEHFFEHMWIFCSWKLTLLLFSLLTFLHNDFFVLDIFNKV